MKATALPEPDEEIAGATFVRRSRGIVAKRPRSQSSEAGLSLRKKKARREPETEIIPKKTLMLEAELESIFSSDEETDEDDELSPSTALRSKGLHTRGPVVTGIEEVLLAEEEAGGVEIESAATLEQQTIQECEAV